MPTSGCLMIGWYHSLWRPSSAVTCRPSTLKKRPLECTRLPVPGSKDQPRSLENGMRSTLNRPAFPRAVNQSWNASVVRRPAVAAADVAIRSATESGSRGWTTGCGRVNSVSVDDMYGLSLSRAVHLQGSRGPRKQWAARVTGRR